MTVMTKLERIDNAMNRIEAAINAATRAGKAVFQLEEDDVFELSEKKAKQYHRLMRFYGELLHDLSDVQYALLLDSESDDGGRPWDDPRVVA